jgi:peptidoglycan/xylan/chitin deacetylase (PgdA/CDA1 family)
MLFTIPKLAVGLSAIFGLVSAAGMITNCKPGYIALTYDDGPHKYTRNLVSLLNRNKVKATFFVNGHNFKQVERKACLTTKLISS